MTLNPLMTRERVTIPDRKAPTKAEKVAAWSRENGLCVRCGKPVAPLGEGVQYDHLEPREITGRDGADELYPLHTQCHAEKTARIDLPRIAKVRRQEKLTRAKVKKPGGFAKGRFYRGVDGQVKERRT